MSQKSHRKPKRTVVEKMSAFSGYPVEGLQKIPLIDCKWNREVHVCGCIGILEYDEVKIVLKTQRGTCGFTGEDMYMENFHSDTLTVRGTIHTIRFCEGGEGDV